MSERGLTATATDADAAVRIAVATRLRVVLMDLHFGAKSGVQAIEAILAKLPRTSILVLFANGEHTDVLDAVKAGATGYLVKSAGVEELIAAVRRTADGFPVFTPGLAGLVLGEYRRLAGKPEAGAGAAPMLTERETRAVCDGAGPGRQLIRCKTAHIPQDYALDQVPLSESPAEPDTAHGGSLVKA